MKLLLPLILLTTITTGTFAASSLFVTDIEKTFLEAKKEKKPVIISFFGIWCPPCNELEETVFESTNFIQKAKAFKLLKVDADDKASWAIKDKYKVGGYPTIVFTNSTGGELYRVVGYRAPKEFVRIMDLVLSAKGKDLSKACESKVADDLWRCALVCAERKDHKCAEAAYKKLEAKLKPGSARYEEARTYFVDNAATDDLKRDGYERLIKESPQSPRALMWSLDYLKLYSEGATPGPKTELIEKVLASYPQMISDARADEFGISATDMVQIRAILLGKLGKPDESKKAWKEAADSLAQVAATLPPGAPARGFTIERISCLEEAGLNEEALKLAVEYRARFPNEFTFHYWTANLLERAKKYNDALPIAKRAYEVSYGDNRIRVATLLINLYSTIPDKESAKKVFEEVTKEIKPDATLDVRTHRYLQKLAETYKKVST